VDVLIKYHVIAGIDPQCDMVGHPDFRTKSDISNGHVLVVVLGAVVIDAVTGNDVGVENTFGHEVINKPQIELGDIHVILGTRELSLAGKHRVFVVHVGLHEGPGAFNTQVIRDVIPQATANQRTVFQILLVFEEVDTSERGNFNAAGLDLGVGRQGEHEDRGQ